MGNSYARIVVTYCDVINSANINLEHWVVRACFYEISAPIINVLVAIITRIYIAAIAHCCCKGEFSAREASVWLIFIFYFDGLVLYF